jgi:hypothetical protein
MASPRVADRGDGLQIWRVAANILNTQSYQYQVTIKYKFAAQENLDDNGDINRAWETIRENIKISAKESIRLCESKSYKPWFDEECLKWFIEGSGLNYSGCRTQVK